MTDRRDTSIFQLDTVLVSENMTHKYKFAWAIVAYQAQIQDLWKGGGAHRERRRILKD